MVDAPATTNATAALLDRLIAAGMNGGEKAVEAVLTAEFPILAEPFLQFLLEKAVQEIGDSITRKEQLIITFVVIDLQTKGENSDVYKALKILSEKQGDPNANQQADDAWTKLIRSDGSAIPSP